METNKIYLGDAYELIKQIEDKSIDLIYTDIPYSFSGNGLITGGGCFGTKKRDYHDEYEKVSINTNASEIHKRALKAGNECKNIAFGIDFSILDEFVRILKKIYVYIWCSKEQILPLMKYFIEDHNCYFEILTWHKTNPIPTVNGKYLPDTEYCLMFREKGTKINGTYKTKLKYYLSGINKQDKDIYMHPTIKPLDYVKNHIINSTNENDIILDPFIGSGTTAVACMELGRQFIGFEINEEYYKIAVDRLNGIDQYGQTSLFDKEYYEQLDLLKGNNNE